METQYEKVPSNVQEVPGRDETMRKARERLNQTLSGVSEQAKHAAQYADETVHNNPWTSVGVAFGLGAIFGALIALAASSSSRRIF
ncbi:MAG TPA: hypothetical protein VFB93_21595 [Burkholderiales bacterium]|nr:hypothetical protein [Burkholderiales bacterium]